MENKQLSEISEEPLTQNLVECRESEKEDDEVTLDE